MLSKVPWLLLVFAASIFQVNAGKSRRPLDTMDLEELPDSREHTGTPVLWLSNRGRTDVWELFSDNSYFSFILDRQGLSVAVPVDLGTKCSESFSRQLLQGFWSKLKKKNPKISVMSPMVTTKNSKQKGSHMATVLSVLGRSRLSNQWW